MNALSHHPSVTNQQSAPIPLANGAAVALKEPAKLLEVVQLNVSKMIHVLLLNAFKVKNVKSPLLVMLHVLTLMNALSWEQMLVQHKTQLVLIPILALPATVSQVWSPDPTVSTLVVTMLVSLPIVVMDSVVTVDNVLILMNALMLL